MKLPGRLAVAIVVAGLAAAAALSQPPRAQAGFDIDATLSLSKYSGRPLDHVKVTYRITTVPVGGCWFIVGIEFDGVTWGQGLSFPSLDNCTTSGTFTVRLGKPWSNVGKHKVCATPLDIYGPRGPTICRTFTILAKVSATPKPTPTATPTPTPSPTLAPTLEPSPSPTPTPMPATEQPSVAAPTLRATPDPSTTAAVGTSTIGLLGGAALGALIVVIVGVRMFRPARSRQR